ncbi:MAG: PD-(D/E)XK nuclease family protein [bacterium]|nr:PD-(D/E)XK nuclease family protein [bacterium]
MQSTDADPGADPGRPPADPAEPNAPLEESRTPADTAEVVQMPVRPKHLSPSSASVLRQCPQRWKFRYVDRLPDPPGEAALAGTFAHRVLEDLLGLEPTERTMDSARAIARQTWSEMEADDAFRALDLDPDGIRNFKWTAWRAIEGLWDLEDPKTVELIDTEAEVSVEIDGVPFIGYIDRVEAASDGLVVSDYKSGRAPGRKFSKARLEQVLLYAAALAELHGTLPARARLMYLGQRIDETIVTAEAIAEVTRRLVETWEELQERSDTGDFPPRPGPLCGWCAFVRHCPEGLAEVQRRHLAGALRPDAPALAEAV